MQQTNTTQPLKTKGSPEFLPAIIFFKLCKQLYLNMLITVPQERWESACLWVKSGKAQISPGVLAGYTVTKFNNTKKMLSEDGLKWETSTNTSFLAPCLTCNWLVSFFFSQSCQDNTYTVSHNIPSELKATTAGSRLMLKVCFINLVIKGKLYKMRTAWLYIQYVSCNIQQDVILSFDVFTLQNVILS